MSYTTRCPACGTMFKVVPDQLKISDGWVRCGHCADVFDATLYLDEWADADVPAPAVGGAPNGPASPLPQARNEPEVVSPVPQAVPLNKLSRPAKAAAATRVQASHLPPWPFDDELPGEQLSGFAPLRDFQATEPMPLPDRVTDALTRALTAAVSEGAPPLPLRSRPEAAAPVTAAACAPVEEAVPPARARRGVTDDFRAELIKFASSAGGAQAVSLDPVDVPVGLPLHAEVPPQEAAKAPDRPGVSAASVVMDLDEPEPEPAPAPEPVPEFVQQARRKAFWRRPLVRVAMILLWGVLAGALLAQWAHHERHALVAWQPRLEPVLRLMCEPPACEIGPLRRIDDIVIDSAALVRRLGNFYSFDIVLKNQADVALAVPALELTLTDTRDQTMARRVFLPEEWPEQPATVPARGSISVSLRLAIELGDGVPMAGYRALVFYP